MGRDRFGRVVIKLDEVPGRGIVGRLERNIHDSASDGAFGVRAKVFDTGARGVGLLEGVVLVSIQRAEEPPIIDHRRVNRTWKTVRVEPVAVRLVELFVLRVVDKEDIGVGASADGDSIHGVCLVV